MPTSSARLQHQPGTMNLTVSQMACHALMACAALAAGLTLPDTALSSAPDYGLLDEVLLHNVRNGYVDYDGIALNPKFAEFVRQLGDAPTEPFASREAELAFYINAYNAVAIQGILDGYSPATRFGRHRFLKGREYRLLGTEISLDDLEHKRIRPLGDPRIHFAIVCASISCPRLSHRAYLPETLDAQLDEAAQRFVNDVTRNRLDVAQKTAFISRIFDWFREDFEKASGSVPQYLAQYVSDPAVRAALLDGRMTIRYLPYDWELNGRYAGHSDE